MQPNWQPTNVVPAPEDQVVQTKIDDDGGVRNVQLLRRRGNLWFFPDMSMYVYYTPSHWAEVQSDLRPVKERAH